MYYQTVEEWKKDPQGLGNTIGMMIAMPEFEGVIEPIVIGGASNVDGELQTPGPHPGSVSKSGPPGAQLGGICAKNRPIFARWPLF